MQVTILGVTIEITVYRTASNPLTWGRAKRRRIGRQVDIEREHMSASGCPKIQRIKVLRVLCQDHNYNGVFGLREQKRWVEMTWANGGNGELL